MSDTMLSGPSSPRRRARVVLRLALATACVAALAFPVSAQRPVFPDTPNPTAGNVEVFHVQGKVWLLAGADGNITAQVGDDGLVLVDTGLEAFSERVLTELRALSEKPIRMIVNTTVALDHIGGNDELSKTGEPLYLASNSGGVTIPGAQLVGHERAALALSRRRGPDAG